MNKTLEYVKAYVSKHKYKIIGEDENHIAIRYQLNNIIIFYNYSENFIQIVLSNFDEITKKNRREISKRCNELNKMMMQVKFYTDKNVVASAEFYYFGKKDLFFQMDMALDGLIDAKQQYNKYKP